MKFNGLVPELYVSDYHKSLAFYRDLLGFTVEYIRSDPNFAFLSLYSSQLMIQQKEATDHHTGTLEYPYGRGINFQIEVPSIELIFSALESQRYPLGSPIKECWRQIFGGLLSGSRELQVLDPDGYYLRFSEELGLKDAT